MRARYINVSLVVSYTVHLNALLLPRALLNSHERCSLHYRLCGYVDSGLIVVHDENM